MLKKYLSHLWLSLWETILVMFLPYQNLPLRKFLKNLFQAKKWLLTTKLNSDSNPELHMRLVEEWLWIMQGEGRGV